MQESRWSDGFAVSMRTECWSIGTRNKTRSARMPGHPLRVHIESNPITTLDRKTEETYGFLRQQTGMNGANMTATQAAWPATISWFRKYLGS